jgi:hypothetical protein
MSKKWRYALWVYLAGALLMEAVLLLEAYRNGGFEREHSVRDLLEIGILHLAAAALWPVLIVVEIFQYFRILHLPITF